MTRKDVTPFLVTPMDGEVDGDDSAAHRAFLLYGMQSPERRSQRQAAKAIGKNESTIRSWRERYAWEARLSRKAADRDCVNEYWRRYNDKLGDGEVRQIAKLMRHAYEAPRELETVDDAATTGELAAEALRDSEREKYSKRRRQLGTLTDAMIVTLGQALKNGKVRFGAGDIEKLMRTAHLLRDTEGSADGAGTGPMKLIESLRVRLARSSGTNVLEAALEDTEEQLLILRQLLSKPLPTPVSTAEPVEGEGESV